MGTNTFQPPVPVRQTRPAPWRCDFDLTPFVAIWEITRACDLACRHCRAEAISQPLPGELTTAQGLAVLDQLAQMGTPICVLTGGDPAKRADLIELVRHGAGLGMRMATIPAATPRLTLDLVRSLKDAGLAQMALSLDGPTSDVHDRFRETPGTFDITMQGARYASEVGMPLQINTTLSAYNFTHFDALTSLVKSLGVVFWEVFFLVPTGRGRLLKQLDPRQFEAIFAKLSRLSDEVDFVVKVTEAPHYRRYRLQHSADARNHRRKGHVPSLAENRSSAMHDPRPGGRIGLAPRGVNAGCGHLFISYRGDIYPSGFLPLCCGNCLDDSLEEVYRRHRVFRDLRRPDRLKGKCGACWFRRACGGSRARAFAMTGDYLESEPLCLYQPHRVAASPA